MNYLPIKIKTNYSLLQSLIDIKKLINYAKENNIKSLGICDDNLCAAMSFYEEAIKNGIKPIIGLDLKEIYLYAKNYEGYKNLCYISSNEFSIELIKNNSDNLICILPFNSIDKYDIYKDIFKDIFVSYKNTDERKNINNKKCIYLNDVLALSKDDTKYIKYIYMIKDNKKINEFDEYNFDNNYLLYNEVNKLDLINYKIINDMCNIKIKKQDDLLPVFNSDENFNEKLYLKKLAEKGLTKRLNNKVPKKYVDRLYYELDIINKMGFSNYFLIVWDYIKYAKKNNILVGPGRGSAAGSLVSYSLGITDIDPIKYNLLFERFLNPERVTMPDIDVDFDSRKREEVINYVKKKYGIDKVCNIITFSILKSKQVLRDVFRIFDISNDYFISLFDSNKTLIENRKENNEINNMIIKDTLLSKIFDICVHLEGLRRHISINAAGIIISNKTISKYIPVYKQSDINITGYTIEHLEKLGFLKMDFLSLDNLVLLSNLRDNININLNDIPLDDKKTFDVFNKANTDGIFQFESTGIKQVLKKFNVTSFDDLVALLALYRPGPMNNIDLYIKRKNKKEKITYINDELKDILESTYGIILYQEQILQIAKKTASFTLGEADILRRAMSKKNKAIMDKLKTKFIIGAKNNNYSDIDANKIYDLIYKFADYGFNKSHSVCYALISYRLAYLKANYPAHFMSYLLTNNVSNPYKIKDYVLECKNNNIKVLKPDINISESYFLINNYSIIFPISSIKNVGNIISKEIIKEREKGLFKDFLDFTERCYKFINKKVLLSLIDSGCFDSFNYNHKTLINSIDIALNYAELCIDLDSSFVEKPTINEEQEYSKEELIQRELDVFGFYLSNHPVQYKRKNNITTKDIKNYFNKKIEIYLIIDRKKEITTKNGEKMAFLNSSDEYNKIELILFPKIYENSYKINRGNIVFVKGKVEKKLNEYQIIVNEINTV